VIWPGHVLNMHNYTLFFCTIQCLNLDFTLYKVWHDGFYRDERDLKCSFKCKSFFNLCWEILIALGFPAFFDTSKHNYKLDFLLLNHSPKVFNCSQQRTLSRDKKLIVLASGRVDIVCIDIRIKYISVSLSQPHPSMFN
jgi:hypothetical protein